MPPWGGGGEPSPIPLKSTDKLHAPSAPGVDLTQTCMAICMQTATRRTATLVRPTAVPARVGTAAVLGGTLVQVWKIYPKCRKSNHKDTMHNLCERHNELNVVQ